MHGQVGLSLHMNGVIHTAVIENNLIMDNVLDRMAGLSVGESPAGLGNYQIAIGTGFSDDELDTTKLALDNQIYISNPLTISHGTKDRFFTVQVDIDPTQSNGNLIEMGLMSNGILYNRAIFKRYGSLLDSTTYYYKVVASVGANISTPSTAVSALTGSGGLGGVNTNTNKISWAYNSFPYNYSIYKSTDNITYTLLSTTNKLFFYDDGFTSSIGSIPSPHGVVPTPVATILTQSTPTPYSIQKTSDFAATAMVRI